MIEAVTHQFSTERYYMFGFNYNGGEPNEVIVEKPTMINKSGLLFVFLYGHKSLSEHIPFESIVAVGEEDGGEAAIKGWTGSYTILNQPLFDALVHSGVICLKG